MTIDASQQLCAALEQVRRIRSKGVRVWWHDDRLHYKGVKGLLAPEDIQSLRACSEQFALRFRNTSGVDAQDSWFSELSYVVRAPLSFSQLSHWNSYLHGERPAARQLATAIHLQGTVDVEALQLALTELSRHHDALRTNILVCSGSLMQEVSAVSDVNLEIHDLTSFTGRDREIGIKRCIETAILRVGEREGNSLGAVCLIKLDEREHILVFAMEHTVCDGVSMGVLCAHLGAGYGQALKDEPISLPPAPVQPADYALWQRQTQGASIVERADWWLRSLSGCPRTRFPQDLDRDIDTAGSLGWRTVPVTIAADLAERVRAFCRKRGTTPVMVVLAAYTALVLRWCDVSESVVQFQSNGRMMHDLRDAVGCFTFPLFIHIAVSEKDTFLDLLSSVIDRYCDANEHADFCYLWSQHPRHEITRNTVFNWLPARPAHAIDGRARDHGGVTCKTFPFEHPMFKRVEADQEPTLMLLDEERQFSGQVCFSARRHSPRTMRRFADNLPYLLGAFVESPESRVMRFSPL